MEDPALEQSDIYVVLSQHQMQTLDKQMINETFCLLRYSFDNIVFKDSPVEKMFCRDKLKR
ncbi:unnamed protein product, partial [Leptidea sinapis]